MEVGSCSYNYSNFDQPSSSSHQAAARSSSKLTQGATDCSRYKDEGTFEEEEEQAGARARELVAGTGSSGLAGSTGVRDATKDPRPKGWTSSSSKTAMSSEAVEETTTACEVQQEGGVALWVKWRGKWRACIQCFPGDCSAATAKAMPTYNKKTYVVVFFPNSRTYFWVDLQYACHISESPEPLAFGTHESGRRAVENLDMPKHHMLQALTTSMLDISDKLPIKAVVRSAQNVKAWKDFANDAMKAKEYNDISNMLVRLFWMIDPSYYSKEWLKEGFGNWKEGCEKANTAQDVENLNKELVSSILWDDIQPLWDAPEQAVVGAEWKDWKYTVLENKSLFPTVMPSPDSTLYVDDSFAKRRRIYRAESAELPSLDSAAKRSKLKVRGNGLPDLNSGAPAEGCCVVSTDNQSLDKPNPISTPPSTLKMDEVPSPVWTSKRLASNYQLCSAYMEKKRRQCTRFPSQGSLFCCKHMALASGEAIEGVKRMDAVAEQKPFVSDQKPVVPQHKSTTILPKSPNDRICEGNTKFGRRCTHRAREGSLFCKKHTFADAPHLNPETGERIFEPPPTEVKNVEANGQGEENQVAASPPGQPEEAQVMNESEDQGKQVHSSSGKRKAVSHFPSDRGYPVPWHAKRIGRLIKHNSGERVRCLGKCVNGEQCSHKSRPGFSYCEKHQPDMTGEARPESDADTRKQDAAEVLVKAKSLLSRYMETANRKADGENESALLRWILEEVSRDLPVAECLMKLVTQRKEKLGKFLELSEASKAIDVETGGEKSSGFDEGGRDQETPKPLPDEQQLEQLEQLDKIKCSICSDDFDEMVELGKHWKSSHMTEAHWFLKGYLCKECNKEFTNKSSFERHCKTVHEGAAEVACVAVCINCDEQFCDFKELFDHVVASHADHLSAMPTISLPANGDDMEASRMEDEEQNNDESAAVNGTKDDSGDESFEFPSSLEDSLDEVDGEKEEYDDGTGPMRFKCKICSKRFKLLPELGRHHQLAHMTAQLASPMTKLRNGGSASIRSSRKQCHDEAVLAALQTVQKSKADGGDRVKQPGPPDNQELISAASSACCEANLRASLEQKYESVPKELLVRVLKLAGGVDVPKWTREGYVCPHTCKQVGQLVERAADTRTHVFRKSNILKKKSSVLCEDMSFGKEPLPIPCVEDEDTEQCICSHCREGKSYYVDSERPWETYTYITKRMLDPSLGVDTKDSQIGCACGKHHCSAKSCLHVYLFDNDNAEASDIWGEEMAGRFPYDDQGRIILQEGYLVYECNTSCPCQQTCPNRVLQRGVNVKLEVFKTRHKGWAVRAAQHIPRGTFVCEYLGEVLNDQEANRRGERYDQVGCSYLYDIDVHLNRGRSRRGPRVKPFVIDATKYGNVSRFMNHSCSPNLVNYQVLVESMDSRLAHIGLYASRDIAYGEELSYDYRYKLLPGRGCPCHCGSSGCRGRLY